MPPTRAAGAKKAASRRVTPRRDNVVDFDKLRVKVDRSTAARDYKIRAYGRIWHLQRANQVVTVEILQSEDVSAMLDYLLAHVVPEDREPLLEKLRTDEHLGPELMNLLIEEATKVVYADIPTAPS